MKFVARVVETDGPLKNGRVEIVSTDRGGQPVPIGKGVVTDGELSAAADPGAVWGIWIDQRAIVAVPVSSEGEVVNLGEIVMVPGGLAWPAFHATDGRVYGVPRPAQPAERVPLPPPPAEPVTGPRLLPTDQPLPRIARKMTFGDLVGSTARQLSTASETVTSNFALTGATVTLKGVASATEDAVALEFPTIEMVTSGVVLSEISFSIRPKVEPATPGPAAPAGSRVPDLIGYTRDLAMRKAAAAGFITEINNEIVSDAALAGKVVRHGPSPGAALPPGGLIRLYIGKI